MTAPTTHRPVSATAVRALRRSLHGALLTPDDDAYHAARAVWNAMVDRHPALICRCADPADVATVVRFARASGLEIGVRGGGHSVLGQAVPDGGVVIDLGPIDAVEVDPARRLARVGGGALLGGLDRAAASHGLATTAGNVSHTGVGGLTLGGGMGWLARQFGMACDNVLAYELVTADGELVTASDSENPDLAWGLRGGGGNFGVVTTFTFRLHPFAGRALSVDFFYPIDRGPDVLRGWRSLAAEAPRQATPTAWVGTTAAWPFLPSELQGQPMVNAGFVWAGHPDEGRALMPAYRAIAEPAAEVVEELSYLDLQSGADEPMRQGLRRYWKGYYLRELTDDAIAAFLSRGAAPGPDGWLPNGSLQAYGGAIAEVGMEATAFSQRDARVEFTTVATWEDAADDASRMAAARSYGSAVEPYSSGVYVNALADEGTRGTEHAYRAETLRRLTALKDRYDPGNVFHLNHNIPPSAAPA